MAYRRRTVAPHIFMLDATRLQLGVALSCRGAIAVASISALIVLWFRPARNARFSGCSYDVPDT